MFFTYILYSAAFDRYYVGHCEDMEARLVRHNARAVKSTKPYVPWVVAYTETYHTRAEAASRELAIKKKKSRSSIEKLIGGGSGGHAPI